VRAIAAEVGATPAQVALAWLLAQGDDILPIPGTKRVRYLEENLGATEVELTDDDLKALEEAVPRDAVAGDRYADMSTVNA
jgi:aryl-alcohol dehydrogenase-like predicted oxidoreductase